jgi:trk system potassium uptake protein TrkH
VADQTLRKATVVMTLAVSTVMFALVALQLTQHMPIEMGVFEIVSALGTVGLSTGGTGLLDEVGKLIVTGCMFVGRVGGLSMLMFLSQRKPRGGDGFLEQDVDVG